MNQLRYSYSYTTTTRCTISTSKYVVSHSPYQFFSTLHPNHVDHHQLLQHQHPQPQSLSRSPSFPSIPLSIRPSAHVHVYRIPSISMPSTQLLHRSYQTSFSPSSANQIHSNWTDPPSSSSSSTLSSPDASLPPDVTVFDRVRAYNRLMLEANRRSDWKETTRLWIVLIEQMNGQIGRISFGTALHAYTYLHPQQAHAMMKHYIFQFIAPTTEEDGALIALNNDPSLICFPSPSDPPTMVLINDLLYMCMREQDLINGLKYLNYAARLGLVAIPESTYHAMTCLYLGEAEKEWDEEKKREWEKEKAKEKEESSKETFIVSESGDGRDETATESLQSISSSNSSNAPSATTASALPSTSSPSSSSSSSASSSLSISLLFQAAYYYFLYRGNLHGSHMTPHFLNLFRRFSCLTSRRGLPFPLYSLSLLIHTDWKRCKHVKGKGTKNDFLFEFESQSKLIERKMGILNERNRSTSTSSWSEEETTIHTKCSFAMKLQLMQLNYGVDLFIYLYRHYVPLDGIRLLLNRFLTSNELDIRLFHAILLNANASGEAEIVLQTWELIQQTRRKSAIDQQKNSTLTSTPTPTSPSNPTPTPTGSSGEIHSLNQASKEEGRVRASHSNGLVSNVSTEREPGSSSLSMELDASCYDLLIGLLTHLNSGHHQQSQQQEKYVNAAYEAQLTFKRRRGFKLSQQYKKISETRGSESESGSTNGTTNNNNNAGLEKNASSVSTSTSTPSPFPSTPPLSVSMYSITLSHSHPSLLHSHPPLPSSIPQSTYFALLHSYSHLSPPRLQQVESIREAVQYLYLARIRRLSGDRTIYYLPRQKVKDGLGEAAIDPWEREWCSALLHAYAHNRSEKSMAKAEQVIADMQLHGEWREEEISIRLYNLLLHLYSHRDVKKCSLLFQLLDSWHMCDEVTFVTMIRCYVHAHQMDDAKRIYLLMIQKYGLAPFYSPGIFHGLMRGYHGVLAPAAIREAKRMEVADDRELLWVFDQMKLYDVPMILYEFEILILAVYKTRSYHRMDDVIAYAHQFQLTPNLYIFYYLIQIVPFARTRTTTRVNTQNTTHTQPHRGHQHPLTGKHHHPSFTDHSTGADSDRDSGSSDPVRLVTRLLLELESYIDSPHLYSDPYLAFFLPTSSSQSVDYSSISSCFDSHTPISEETQRKGKGKQDPRTITAEQKKLVDAKHIYTYFIQLIIETLQKGEVSNRKTQTQTNQSPHQTTHDNQRTTTTRQQEKEKKNDESVVAVVSENPDVDVVGLELGKNSHLFISHSDVSSILALLYQRLESRSITDQIYPFLRLCAIVQSNILDTFYKQHIQTVVTTNKQTKTNNNNNNNSIDETITTTATGAAAASGVGTTSDTESGASISSPPSSSSSFFSLLWPTAQFPYLLPILSYFSSSSFTGSSPSPSASTSAAASSSAAAAAAARFLMSHLVSLRSSWSHTVYRYMIYHSSSSDVQSSLRYFVQVRMKEEEEKSIRQECHNQSERSPRPLPPNRPRYEEIHTLVMLILSVERTGKTQLLQSVEKAIDRYSNVAAIVLIHAWIRSAIRKRFQQITNNNNTISTSASPTDLNHRRSPELAQARKLLVSLPTTYSIGIDDRSRMLLLKASLLLGDAPISISILHHITNQSALPLLLPLFKRNRYIHSYTEKSELYPEDWEGESYLSLGGLDRANEPHTQSQSQSQFPSPNWRGYTIVSDYGLKFKLLQQQSDTILEYMSDEANSSSESSSSWSYLFTLEQQTEQMNYSHLHTYYGIGLTPIQQEFMQIAQEIGELVAQKVEEQEKQTQQLKAKEEEVEEEEEKADLNKQIEVKMGAAIRMIQDQFSFTDSSHSYSPSNSHASSIHSSSVAPSISSSSPSSSSLSELDIDNFVLTLNSLLTSVRRKKERSQLSRDKISTQLKRQVIREKAENERRAKRQKWIEFQTQMQTHIDPSSPSHLPSTTPNPNANPNRNVSLSRTRSAEGMTESNEDDSESELHEKWMQSESESETEQSNAETRNSGFNSILGHQSK